MAGGQPLPPRPFEQRLRRGIARGEGRPIPVRLIRMEGRRAIVEIPHFAVSEARLRWNGALGPPGEVPIEVRTLRSYGTLVKAKSWLRSREGRRRSGLNSGGPPN